MFGIDVKEQAKRISDLKNPFMADKIVKFSTYCYPIMGRWKYSGTIGFKNGNTEGEQKFQADDFGALLTKMEKFMADLGAKT